jgi:hypothetical protein
LHGMCRELIERCKGHVLACDTEAGHAKRGRRRASVAKKWPECGLRTKEVDFRERDVGVHAIPLDLGTNQVAFRIRALRDASAKVAHQLLDGRTVLPYGVHRRLRERHAIEGAGRVKRDLLLGARHRRLGGSDLAIHLSEA